MTSISRMLAFSLCQSLEKSLNLVLAQDTSIKSEVAGMEGKIVQIEITDLRVEMELEIQAGEVFVTPGHEREGDLQISGRLADFMKSVRTSMGSSMDLEHLKVTGDMSLAQNIFRLFRRADFDWEEALAQKIGDVPARTFGNALRWGQENLVRKDSPLQTQIRTVLEDKTQLIPSRERVGKFMDGVDALKADVDRIEKRIDRLVRKDKK